MTNFNSNTPCPSYLKQFSDLWSTNPHEANLAWWKQAKFGMFIHYGLYSQLGENEWAQYLRKIPVKEYDKLKHSFTAHNFDADFITDLALECGMQYINLVTCHHDGFCLWDSKIEEFNSANSPCGRDLVREMAQMCDKKGLGLFTYYTFIQNWRAPHAPSNDIFETSRPHYDKPQPEYLYKGNDDFKKFVEYITSCIDELISDVGTTAGIWLDLIMGYSALSEKLGFNIDEIYKEIRKTRPDILISWKQGANGEEDFATPEQHFHSLEDKIRRVYGEKAALEHKSAWEKNIKKHNEINMTLQEGSWAFNPFKPHRNADYLYNLLGHAAKHDSNLCVNVGPLGDGSISPIQVKILRELGERIRREGWPKPKDMNF